MAKVCPLKHCSNCGSLKLQIRKRKSFQSTRAKQNFVFILPPLGFFVLVYGYLFVQGDLVPFFSIVAVYSAWGDVCGQSPWNPLPEPNAFLINTGGQTAHNYLIGANYHMVPFYAALTFDRDHAITTDYLECDNGEMRMQGMINEPRDPVTSNEFHSQGPEPNPEILSYTAPAIWWDGYVIIWHGLF